MYQLFSSVVIGLVAAADVATVNTGPGPVTGGNVWNPYDINNCARILSSTTTLSPKSSVESASLPIIGSSSSSSSSSLISLSSSSSSSDDNHIITDGVTNGANNNNDNNKLSRLFRSNSKHNTFITDLNNNNNNIEQLSSSSEAKEEVSDSVAAPPGTNNGIYQSQIIMCKCVKTSLDTTTGVMNQESYNDCIEAAGYDANSFDYSPYMNNYNNGGTGTSGSSSNNKNNNYNYGNYAGNYGGAYSNGGSYGSSGNNGANYESQYGGSYTNAGGNNGNTWMSGSGVHSNVEIEGSSQTEIGISKNSQMSMDNENNGVSIAHSDSMRYLAIGLWFVGVIVLITFGVKCIKYTNKMWRLRNYEQIGENSKIRNNTNSNKINKINKQQRKGNNFTMKNMINNTENEIYTIDTV